MKFGHFLIKLYMVTYNSLIINEKRLFYILFELYFLLIRYAYFEAKKAAPTVLGRAMNNFRFHFKHRMMDGCSEYWLCEK